MDLGGLPPGPETEVRPGEARMGTKGRVVLRRETAHRGGKTVVVVGGFADSVGAGELERIAKGLRKACGCGGTVRGREIEVQGEQADRVRAWLEGEGYRVAGVRGGG